MNVLLLGNGFDIYHKLPTKYHNFLHVVEILIDHENERFICAGDVFKLAKVQAEDEFIGACYEAHKDIYDKLNLDEKLQGEIVRLCKDNLWFRYFSASFDKDAGWIDFEKEISHTLKAFKIFLDNADVKFCLNDIFENRADLQYVISYFNFFYGDNENHIDMGIYPNKVNSKYIREYPAHSKNYIIDKQKIVGLLFEQLENIAKALQLYLLAFVENALSLIKDTEGSRKCEAFVDIDHTVTFNYTNTYNVLYSDNSTDYLHGNISDEIILGINPDEYDELEKIDTLMVAFKKYFQRNLLDSDVALWKWLSTFRSKKKGSVLLIMGHSLDVTDEDIIKELIKDAKRIYVFYHNNDAKVQYITNLITMYGKEQYDNIRHEKKLEFISLESDFKELKKVLDANCAAKEHKRRAATLAVMNEFL